MQIGLSFQLMEGICAWPQQQTASASGQQLLTRNYLSAVLAVRELPASEQLLLLFSRFLDSSQIFWISMTHPAL